MVLLIILLILLWGSSVAVTKVLLLELDPFQISLYTRVISSVALVISIIAMKKGIWFRDWGVKEYIKMSGLGIIGMAAPFILITSALKLSPAVEVTILSYLWPIFFVIFCILIGKESFSAVRLGSLAIAALGAYLIIGNGKVFYIAVTFLPGYSLAVLGAALTGLFAACMKKNRFDELISIFFFNLVSVPFFALLLFTNSELVFPSLKATVWLGVLGILINGIGYVIYISLLKKEQDIANVMYLVPFVSILFFKIFFDSPIYVYSIVGLVLILSSIAMQKKSSLAVLNYSFKKR